MTNKDAHSRDAGIYYRLITLWVLIEAMLGGIIHGLRIPISGLVVGSCAAICISLIAWYVPSKGAILKATIIVAIFKMMLSPQAPPPAYVAVFFQGLLGELVFWDRRYFKLACITLAVLGLLESGFQRILRLTIVYGNDFWDAINDFINGLANQKAGPNYILFVGIAYLLIHLMGGLLAGWFAAILPTRIEKWKEENKNALTMVTGESITPAQRKRKQHYKTGMLIIWLLLIALYVQSYYRLGTPLLPAHISLRILLRSIIIVFAWIFIVGPLLKSLLQYWLTKKQYRLQTEIQQVLSLLPGMQHLAVFSWRRSAIQKGWRRILVFVKLLLVNALSPIVEAKRFILTAPKQSGKTTSLVKWSETRRDVYGILSPVVNGKRMFMDAHLRHLFEMEADDEELEVFSVGRFRFSRPAFEKAIMIIRAAMEEKGWIVIDEVGPMELKGEGFASIVKLLLEQSDGQQRVILVVREGLADDVRSYFQIPDAVIIGELATA